MTIGYIVPEIWYVTDLIVIFHFGLSFVLLPRKSTTNQILYAGSKSPFNLIRKN